MENDLKKLFKEFKEIDIPIDRIKTINMKWEKILEDRAFPKIYIELYKSKKYEK